MFAGNGFKYFAHQTQRFPLLFLMVHTALLGFYDLQPLLQFIMVSFTGIAVVDLEYERDETAYDDSAGNPRSNSRVCRLSKYRKVHTYQTIYL